MSLSTLLSSRLFSSPHNVRDQSAGMMEFGERGWCILGIREQQTTLTNILTIETTLNTEKYLGMPSMMGRKKREIYGYLKEKLWRKIQQWKKQKLSIAGKEVLVKAKIKKTYPQNCLFSLQFSSPLPYVIGEGATSTGVGCLVLGDLDYGWNRKASARYLHGQASSSTIPTVSKSFSSTTPSARSDPTLPYPPTKLIFIPDKDCHRPDLLASSSDFLRIWQISDFDNGRRVELKSLLNNNCNSEYSGPLTSFDWNEAEPKRIGTSSIDMTFTIWDIEKEVVDTQLIAHDKEVYDISWGGVGVFASVSANGSVRVFDLRDKEHSTIIYESSEPDTPLVRLGWNKKDPRYMATIIMDSSKVVVLDIR
ncbi:uncharacterized protein [Henckelia pumila]|uniref:uncharacterized protein n=1 Tax=Henckelia pumila TaxID=405737 RepID=UPI003C6E3AB2